MFEALLQNPEQITFTLLFVGLLIYVMKTNDVREEHYRATIQDLTKSFEVLKDIEQDVKKIRINEVDK